MDRAGRAGMALHQVLSFSPLLLRVPEAEAVFWPGCALLQLDAAVLEGTLAALARREPGIRLAAGCCGQPTACLFPEKAPKRQEKLRALLARRGVRRIYTACPNCTRELRALGGPAVEPVLPLLAELLRGEASPARRERCVWHDPCPTRDDPVQQAAARALLRWSGCDWTEPEHTGPRTRCCGNLGMLQTRDPQKSAAIRARRLAELPAERTVLSSCEGCLGAFRGAGRDTCHILELLFGRSRSRSWGNRLRNSRPQI